MKKKLFWGSILILMFAFVWFFPSIFGLSNPLSPDANDGKVDYEALVVNVVSEKYVDGFEGQDLVQTLELQLLNGAEKNKKITVDNDNALMANVRVYKKGDHVFVVHYDPDIYYVVDYQRNSDLLLLFGFFVLVVLLISGWQGAGSIVGMIFSFMVIFRLILPLIFYGFSPVWAAISGASLIIPLNFYISHGVSRKTNVAILSTILTLVVTAILATFFADLTHLTGSSGEEAAFLKMETRQLIDFRGLLLAGMIISVLGVLDDITISQSSVVQQLKAAKEKISFGELYSRAMHVGRDHISSLVNTLILVYAGASLPLLLLFLDSDEAISQVMNLEFVAEEIVRTLVGSVGIVLAVPVTTILAVWIVGKLKKGEEAGCGCCH